MKILNLKQGSQEWLEFRERHNTASEASAMMGAHPSVTRNDLLRAKHGVEKEVGEWVKERLFPRGHEAEAACRPAAEAEVGDELFPATVVDDHDWLSASLDGITMDETVIWEHKQFNQGKADHIAEKQTCPPEDYWQVMQQLAITGADRCLYSVGNNPDDMVTLWVEPDGEAFNALVSAWTQFEADAAEFEPRADAPAAVGRTMETLPALHIEVTGEVTASNLAEYKSHALAVFDGINTDLQTDQDFADAEQAVKWCKDVEDRLDAAKQHALSQTQSIDELFRAIDDIKESARQKRLALDKLVQQRKQSIRGEIRQEAERALNDHVAAIEVNRFDRRVSLPKIEADFAAAMKNKRTIKSLRDAVDQVLANAKIKANEAADTIQANLKTFDDVAADHQSLFPDLPHIVAKDPDDFVATIRLRIADHEERERERLEAERERIRAEEQAEARQAAEQPEPAAETRATPETSHERHERILNETTEDLDKAVNGRVTWTVVATYEVSVAAKTTIDQVREGAKQTLKDAGVSVKHVEAQKKKEAA